MTARSTSWKCCISRFLFPALLLVLSGSARSARAGWGKFASKGWKSRYARYFEDTFSSLDCLRAPDGLVRDKMVVDSEADSSTCATQGISQITSPTDIGLDLLVQLAAYRLGWRPRRALRNLKAELSALSKLPDQRPSGLFFNWYGLLPSPHPINEYVSSVDNMHLAIALWTLRSEFPEKAWASPAGRILGRMDFSAFYRPESGLIGGGMRLTAKRWVVDSWSYSYLGSEARTIYAAGWALGFFKDPLFLSRISRSLQSETCLWRDRGKRRPLLRLWDGGAFQLLLPQTLMDEARYSPRMKALLRNYSRFILWMGQRKDLPVPAAFSASQAGVEGRSCGPNLPCYNGKAGSPELVSPLNQDFRDPALRAQWDAVFTPHAAILAAQMAPADFVAPLRRAETLRSDGYPLYRAGLGWMDGYRLKPPYVHTVVPVVLALDQEMIALSLAKILSPDGLSPSARALHRDIQVRERLARFYRALEAKLGP